MVDPLNTVALDAIRTSTGLASCRSVSSLLRSLLNGPFTTVRQARIVRSLDRHRSMLWLQELAGAGDRQNAPPVIAVVDHILTEAVRRRARNVHIEPFRRPRGFVSVLLGHCRL